MVAEPETPQSVESQATLLEQIRLECAAIQQSSICNEELERKLARKYAGPISQKLISGYEIRATVTDRLIELVKGEVTAILNRAPGLKDMFVGPDVPDAPFAQSESEVNGMMAELDWVNTEMLLAPSPFGGYAWDDAESDALRKKVFETESNLRKAGALFAERKKLAEILSDFLMQYSPFPQDQSPIWDEHPILEPVASYIRQTALHNDYTTKLLLTSMFDLIDRLPRAHIGACKKRWILRPDILLFITLLVACGLFSNENTRDLVASWWFLGWAIFLAWNLLRLFNFLRAQLIHSKLKALMGSFSWLNSPITCDGGELVIKLHRIERLGQPVPSLLYALLRLAVPE